jgi:hypothetical protein
MGVSHGALRLSSDKSDSPSESDLLDDAGLRDGLRDDTTSMLALRRIKDGRLVLKRQLPLLFTA